MQSQTKHLVVPLGPEHGGILQRPTAGDRSLLQGWLTFLFPGFRIAYPVVQMATQSGKNVYLTVAKESGNSVVLLFKMISTRAASGLYRALTETHAFYRHVAFRSPQP